MDEFVLYILTFSHVHVVRNGELRKVYTCMHCISYSTFVVLCSLHVAFPLYLLIVHTHESDGDEGGKGDTCCDGGSIGSWSDVDFE